MRVTWAAVTHPGLRRPSNEDSYVARPDLGLYVVADGMGGHAAGEVASRIAVTTIEMHVAGTPAVDVDPSSAAADGTRLAEAFREANHRIATAALDDHALRGMATTATAVIVRDSGRVAIAHVGDTRVYLSGDDQFTRLTEDHSWVEEQVRAGILDRALAQTHPWRNVVTRALSGGDDPAVDVMTVMLAAGDVLVLCSDGLHGVLTDAAMGEILRAHTDLHAACEALVAHANAAGGPDNITVMAIGVHAS
jgi:protein phosphatase